jgi:hypothetical protein
MRHKNMSFKTTQQGNTGIRLNLRLEQSGEAYR